MNQNVENTNKFGEREIIFFGFTELLNITLYS